MKYKLVNNVTKEETICDKVIVNGFDYYVSDEQATEGFYGYINFQGGDIKKIGKYFADDWKKVIATNNSNIDIPKVVDEGERLAKQEHAYNHKSVNEISFRLGVEVGYNKAHETHPFTEQDMINFVEWYETSQEVYEFWRKNRVGIDMNNSHIVKIKENIRKLLQLWKDQQIKTIYYE